MAWRNEKTDSGKDLVWDGGEVGIAASPTKGNANLQNVNISTETGEVMASYARTAQTPPAIAGGTLTASVSDGSTLLAAPSNLAAGRWITIASTNIAKTNGTVEYLVVGAGGGGGGGNSPAAGGGGGAGDVVPGTKTDATVAAYTITVGTGGAGSTGGASPPPGSTGGTSSFDVVASAVGGGGGGSFNSGAFPSGTVGQNGASGGGGGSDTAPAGTGGTGSGTNGHNGGTGRNTATAAGAGGGGAGTVGGDASGSAGGTGGNGLASSISGASVTYGAGGGGARNAGSGQGSGGTGGGGTGGNTGLAPTAGTANTGSGGGGGASNSGAAGGSGVVVIRYLTAGTVAGGIITATGGTITTSGGYTIHTFTTNGTFTITSITLAPGNYYVSFSSGSKVKLSATYDPSAAAVISHGTSGTATFTTINMGKPIAKATESYGDGTTQQYRYYILDNTGLVWVLDSALTAVWFLPDASTTYFLPNVAPTGITILNGWLLVFAGNAIYGKPTQNLSTYDYLTTLPMNGLHNDPNPHYAYTGHQGKAYFTDGCYVGMIFPNTSLQTGAANIQSYAKYTASTTTGTLSVIVSGSSPSVERTPVVFFTGPGGTLPTAITADTVYWIGSYNLVGGTFSVFSASSGGSAIDIQTGAVGDQYFNTFWPFGSDAVPGGSHETMEFENQRLNLPTFEISQCMIEVGNTLIVGCMGSTLYPWNQIDATPSDLIALPESNVKTMINVNNMVYVFAGNKGNIYITNNSVASLVTKVPDYCAGVPGTPSTYIEPYFIWGDSMYLRGRVYFSILDQTATKAGNCGGVWSFVPSQNADISQDVGLALRLENQNSYGTYNGVANVLLPSQNQQATSPQYWTGWQDSYSTGTSTFGIDFTGTIPVTTFIIETDLAPTGTLLDKETFTQAEYKLTTPLAAGDSVQPYWRLNSTDAWTSVGTINLETDNPISGYADLNFQKTQWVQFRMVCTTAGTTASSFIRFKEFRFRKHE